MKTYEKVDDKIFRTTESVSVSKSIEDVATELQREQEFRSSLIIEHNKRLVSVNARIAYLQEMITKARSVGVELPIGP